MDSDCISRWQQKGELHMWPYQNAAKKRNVGLRFNADKAGLDSLLRLLKCLGENVLGVRTVGLQQPPRDVLSIPGCSGETKCFEKLRLVYQKELEGIQFSVEGQKLGRDIGRSGVVEMAQALERYREGEYDFSLPCAVSGGGTYDRSIWFW